MQSNQPKDCISKLAYEHLLNILDALSRDDLNNNHDFRYSWAFPDIRALSQTCRNFYKVINSERAIKLLIINLANTHRLSYTDAAVTLNIPGIRNQSIRDWLASYSCSDKMMLFHEFSLFTAVSNGDLYRARKILKLGANANDNRHSTVTPLSMALMRNDKPMINLLLQAKANIDKPNGEGNTPLIELVTQYCSCIENYHFPYKDNILKYLMCGANPFKRNDKGLSAYDIAIFNQRSELIELFNDARVDKSNVVEIGQFKQIWYSKTIEKPQPGFSYQ